MLLLKAMVGAALLAHVSAQHVALVAPDDSTAAAAGEAPDWMIHCVVEAAPPVAGVSIVLTRVVCAGEAMKVIPFLPTSMRASLGYYRAWGSRIKKVPNTIFRGATHLRYAMMDSNLIKYFVDGAFDDNAALEFLSLKNNALTAVQPGLFRALTNLWFLDLSRNNLVELGVESFVGMASVRYLNLADNQIDDVACGVFHGFAPNLNYVNMSRNRAECRVKLATRDGGDGVPAIVQCNCGRGFLSKSYCNADSCPAGVSDAASLRLKPKAMVVNAGYYWVAESLAEWQQEMQDTKYRARIFDETLVDQNAADAADGAEEGMSTPLMLVCAAGVIGVMVGLVVATRKRSRATVTLSSSGGSSSAVSAAISDETSNTKSSTDSTSDTSSTSDGSWSDSHRVAGPCADHATYNIASGTDIDFDTDNAYDTAALGRMPGPRFNASPRLRVVNVSSGTDTTTSTLRSACL